MLLTPFVICLYYIRCYYFLLILRIVITWLPNVSYYDDPFYTLVRVTDPWLTAFRRVVPPIFGLDLSVLISFVIIQVIMDIAHHLAYGIT
jgi:YggT family protein